eukprot:s2244_g10.t1
MTSNITLRLGEPTLEGDYVHASVLYTLAGSRLTEPRDKLSCGYCDWTGDGSFCLQEKCWRILPPWECNVN